MSNAGEPAMQLKAPFPRYLLKKNDEQQFKHFLELLRQLHINIPLIESLEQISKYVKFLKDILKKKRRVSETEVIALMQECNALVSNNLSKKQKDPRSFTVSKVLIDVHKGELTMLVDNQEMKFNVLNALKFSDDEECQLSNSIELPEEEADQVCEVLALGETMKKLELLSLSERQTKPARPSLKEPLELEPLPDHLKYMLQKHMQTIEWTLADICGINPSYYMHKIRLEEGKTGSIEPQRSWVSPVQCVPKRGGTIVIVNSNNELLPSKTVTGWRICMDYRKLNVVTKKDHFPFPFIDQMLNRLAGKEFYCFLDGYSGYNQILIDPEDQEKMTFTRPFRTFAFRRMPFGLYNALGTFQRCMMTIFSDFLEQTIEVFMDDFSVFGYSFQSCLDNLEVILA
ncbi:uncharacterized protein LOC120081035 [Benincasa hispida]|uniref:uncharacterized protein LOC120081035 n=1 Tax=Benincasa hispida TaxID=102211 RepID=UPI0018FFA515|nr:uncharacterized protein LOC120081035 [Benincasa hispida]